MSISPASPQHDFAADASAILRTATTASLATIDAATGGPYASFITVACEADGTPLFLISKLARHTKNLAADPRASILCVGPQLPDEEAGEAGATADPLARSRLSVFGRAERTDDAAAARRFLARHGAAESYAQFADFAFYRLIIEGAHMVGGFGRIGELEPRDLLAETTGAEALLEAEAGIVAHMNEDHADAIDLYATVLLGAETGPWRMTGCDPEGCDLMAGERALRLAFPARVTSPDEARRALVELVQTARARR